MRGQNRPDITRLAHKIVDNMVIMTDAESSQPNQQGWSLGEKR
jgi:hypothetical protein